MIELPDDPFTRIDRGILAALAFGGLTIGFAPGDDGFIREEGIVFRGKNVTNEIGRLIILINGGYGDKEALPKLRALMGRIDAHPFNNL
jgi:hypothetical protein